MYQINQETIDSLISSFRSLKAQANYCSYSAIKNSLAIFEFPFHVVEIPKGNKLFRVRVHKEPVEVITENVFTDTLELGNNWAINTIRDFGRANEPHQTVFYCSTDSNTSFFETTNLHKNTEPFEISTTSIWNVEKPLNVVSLPIPEKFKGKNPFINNLIDFHSEIERTVFNESNLTNQVLNFFSEEFSKEMSNNSDYLITAAVANHFFNYVGKDLKSNREKTINGILYPSVKFQDTGVNVVLSANSIKRGHLKLENAFCKKTIRTKTGFEDIERIQANEIDNENYRIKW